MTPLAAALQKTANHLLPHRDALVESWVAALSAVTPAPAPSVRDFCTRVVDTLLSRLSRGEVESWLADETLKAEADDIYAATRPGGSGGKGYSVAIPVLGSSLPMNIRL